MPIFAIYLLAPRLYKKGFLDKKSFLEEEKKILFVTKNFYKIVRGRDICMTDTLFQIMEIIQF